MLANRARLIPESRYRLSVDRPPDAQFGAEVTGRVLRGSLTGAAAWFAFAVAGGLARRGGALPASLVCAVAALGVLAIGPLGGFLAPACVAVIRGAVVRVPVVRR